jgi:hypothetical protein
LPLIASDCVPAQKYEKPRIPLPAGAPNLEVGDVILSVDGAVTESAKETMKYADEGH